MQINEAWHLSPSVAVGRGRTPRILVVDDDDTTGALLARFLREDGYLVARAANGVDALHAASEADTDLVLMDVMMPGLNGFEACRRLKAHRATRLLPVVLVTALADDASRVAGIHAGADGFLSKPYNRQELRARVQALLRLKRHTDGLDSAESLLRSLALTIEARDAYTVGHSERLARHAVALGVRLDLSSDDLAVLERGARLHDIGKIGIPDAILLKPGPLTSDEFALMKQHPLIGDRICGTLRSLKAERQIIRWHHERADGSGYPDGLSGDGIPLLAQIVAIADTYDAITTDRPYRRARSEDEACKELLADAVRGAWPLELARAFVAEHDGAAAFDSPLCAAS